MTTSFIRTLLLIACLAVAACSRLGPYRVEVQQGNFVTQDMVAKLKPGMTRDQVRFVLGTPLVTSPFHASRWDYVYRLERGGTVHEERRLTVFFDDDKLARVEGDVISADAGAGRTDGGAAAQ